MEENPTPNVDTNLNITPNATVKDLQKLGQTSVAQPTEPSVDILETFPAPKDENFFVKFTMDHEEFTSSCPKTGQPDFAKINFVYKPNKLCVESKSLKIYYASFRNAHGFGESITTRIAADLMKALDAKWVYVSGNFTPRGGLRWISTALEKAANYDLDSFDLLEIQKLNQWEK